MATETIFQIGMGVIISLLSILLGLVMARIRRLEETTVTEKNCDLKNEVIASKMVAQDSRINTIAREVHQYHTEVTTSLEDLYTLLREVRESVIRMEGGNQSKNRRMT